jgi:signal transduction histidine kinase/ActR/RegA family two-component response regulator
MPPNRPLQALLLLVGGAGTVVIGRALAALPALPAGSLVGLALLGGLTIASGRFSIKIPGRSATISVSEIFVFTVILLYGAGPASLVVAIDGLLMSIGQRRRRLYRALFNIAEPAVSVVCAAAALQAATAALPPLSPLSPYLGTLAMGGSFFVMNSGLTALAVGFESGSPPFVVWKGHALNLAVNYYAAASLAALVVADSQTVNYQAVGFIVPLLILSFFAYREAATRVDAAERHAVEVERLYAEARKRDDAMRQTQKLEAIGRMAGGVAHDFNNMLMAMRGYAELVWRALPGSHALAGDVAEILKAADRAAALTRQLLAFSRRHVAVARVIRPDQPVAAMDKMIRRLIGEDVELATRIEPDVSRIRMDEGQLEQVLMNLAVNARDAMPGGGRLSIELANVTVGPAGDTGSTLPPGEYVRLTVSDTGCGMTDEVRARVFEPFFTTKGEGRGTGLGLATVYGIVEHAGGAIAIDTAVGRGTTFSVYVPATREAEAAAAPEATFAAARGDETVLLVEDEPSVAAVISIGLKRAGYTVLKASGARQALDAVRAHEGRIHVLLTDVVMPGMSGRELADRLLQLRPETPVLFMSGHSNDAVFQRGVEASSVAFLQKPFSMEALTAKIREVVHTPPGQPALAAVDQGAAI